MQIIKTEQTGLPTHQLDQIVGHQIRRKLWPTGLLGTLELLPGTGASGAGKPPCQVIIDLGDMRITGGIQARQQACLAGKAITHLERYLSRPFRTHA